MIPAREIFTEEAMTRPLFQEPSPDIEREDPWSGPKGFMYGGMSQATMASLAEEYFEAANLIIDRINRNELEDYKLANAALFLYGHSVELILKAALTDYDHIHDLSRLAASFAAMVRSKYDQDVPEWIILRLKELAAIDPGSLAFRYGEYRHPLINQNPRLTEEVYKGGVRAENAGRRAGTPNKFTAEVREMIDDGFERLGGLDGLVAWARKSDEHLTAFYTKIWIKLLPITLNAKAHQDVVYKTIEEIRLAYMERGLTLESVARLHQIESQLLEMSAADAGASG